MTGKLWYPKIKLFSVYWEIDPCYWTNTHQWLLSEYTVELYRTVLNLIVLQIHSVDSDFFVFVLGSEQLDALKGFITLVGDLESGVSSLGQQELYPGMDVYVCHTFHTEPDVLGSEWSVLWAATRWWSFQKVTVVCFHGALSAERGQCSWALQVQNWCLKMQFVNCSLSIHRLWTVDFLCAAGSHTPACQEGLQEAIPRVVRGVLHPWGVPQCRRIRKAWCHPRGEEQTRWGEEGCTVQ